MPPSSFFVFCVKTIFNFAQFWLVASRFKRSASHSLSHSRPNNRGTNKRGGADGSPGLVVMGGDSRSEDHWFESKCHILDGHFSH